MRWTARALTAAGVPSPEFCSQQVRRKLLVAKDRQAFLEGQLEPVAAGDPVAGPVVEILVADDGLDPREVIVGGDAGIGEEVLRVEDVEALVLHGPHVEVGCRHDHETVEVEFEIEAPLVPFDRLSQAGHGMVGLADVSRFDPDLQGHLATGAGAMPLLVDFQKAGHEGEEVAGLGEGVFPDRDMPRSLVPRIHQVAVG